MQDRDEFLKALDGEFPEDRLTWQKRLPTFHPEDADEAARLFKLAARFKQPIYITGFGNNIDPQGSPFDRMVVVRTDRLNDLIDISETDLFAKVGSGYPLRELKLELAPRKLYQPHAWLPYVGSAGGAVAVDLAADVNGHDLPIRKYFLQAEVVLPSGEIINPGSVCFKSVSGYDIVKIFARSWGLLGLLVSITVRIMPEDAAEEFAAARMKPVSRKHFLSGLDEANEDTDAVYSRKIKAKFDPEGLLPIV